MTKNLSRSTIVALLILLVLAAAGGYWLLRGSIGADVTDTGTIANKATIEWCGDGESAESCSPTENRFSGSAQSNTVSTTIKEEPPVIPTPSPSPEPPKITTAEFCGLSLSNRTGVHDKLEVTITSSGTFGTKIYSSQVKDANGKLTITDEAFAQLDPTASYTVWVKPAGYLSRKISLVGSSFLGTCATWPSDKNFLVGDLIDSDAANKNKINLADIVRVIYAKNGGKDANITAAYPNGATIADIVTVIRTFHDNPRGEE